MWTHRQGGRRSDRRAFQPGGEGRPDLESRLLLSAARVSAKAVEAKGYVQYFTAHGGQIARLIDTDGEVYSVDVVGTGTVHAQPMKGGRVRLIVEGSTPSTVVAINPFIFTPEKGTAHDFPDNAGHGDGLLHVGAIKVRTGKIGQILGFQTADLSGPLRVPGKTAVDRIALYALKPGASITTGGDLNTLDVYTDLALGGGPGISVGRDLNFLQLAGNLSVGDGSNFAIGRDIGLNAQPEKGSVGGGQGALIGGDMSIAPTGAFTIGRALDAPFVVNGTITGARQVVVPEGGENFVARGGIFA